jgi:diguanylate cyclase (GGDEF)-like protein/PAS domain S-box-containing protein
LVGAKLAKSVARWRAGATPRDLLGRVEWLLLAFALLNTAGALVVVLASDTRPEFLGIAGLISAPMLATSWMIGYRRRSFGPIIDAITIGGICIITMAVDVRWNGDVLALLSAAVFFSAAFGSLPHVLVRAGLLVSIELGQGVSDPATMPMAIVSAVGLMAIAILMHGMASSIDRYEETARREHILAATGLDLVVAADLPDIVSAAVEGAHALCSALPGVRVSLAMVEGNGWTAGSPERADARAGATSTVEGAPSTLPPRFKILAAAGENADEWRDQILDAEQIAISGHGVGDQWLLPAPDCGAADGAPYGAGAAADALGGSPEPARPARPCPQFLPGGVLLTSILVGGVRRGLVIVECPDGITSELSGAIRALSTQLSLAISRSDLQKDTLERQGAHRFQALIQSSSDVISIVGSDGRVRFQSPATRSVFGHDPDQNVGINIGELVHPEDATRVTAMFRQVAEGDNASLVCECRIRHADGSWRTTETRMSNLLAEPAVEGIVLNTRDITDRQALEAELRHQAFHDSLTGLANRALFTNRVEHALAGSKRDGSTIAVLHCDMDGFERLNDGLGFRSGDAALELVADRLRSCVRGQDTVARFDGHEFGLLLDRLGTPADATLAMERIMAVLRQPLLLPGVSVELQPFIGIAVAIAGDGTPEELLRNSALAVRLARNYEGGYAIFDPDMQAEAVRRIEIESQLRTAIDESQFVLHYQPTIDFKTGRLTGVEALVRWQHPKRGLVPPMEFIPLAEESGLIVPLGLWTIQEACRQVRDWQREIPADEPISLNVNLSARQLRHPNIVSDIADALDDTGLLPSRLTLEITESVLMIDTSATLNRLFQLKSLGVRLAVDDFGTGYSSFAYLRRFPFDILKIDKSFVDGVATEPTAGALVDAMIRIGKTLRLETVAEGVEYVEQADRLRALDCDLGQGYYFSRPLTRDAFTALLRDRAAQHEANAA